MSYDLDDRFKRNLQRASEMKEPRRSNYLIGFFIGLGRGLARLGDNFLWKRALKKAGDQVLEKLEE